MLTSHIPRTCICVASLKKTREGADTGFPVPLSRWMRSLSEKMLSTVSGSQWELRTWACVLLGSTDSTPGAARYYHKQSSWSHEMVPSYWEKVMVRKAIPRRCAIYMVIFISEGPDRRLADPVWRNKGGRVLCKLNAEGTMGFGQRRRKTVAGRMNFTCKTGGAWGKVRQLEREECMSVYSVCVCVCVHVHAWKYKW